MMNHPVQPLAKDEQGVVRFKENAIVRFLLDHGPFDLNNLAVRNFDREDRVQFAQLIGYSLSGFGDLGYVNDLDYDTAESIADRHMDERDARIKHLEDLVELLRRDLREPIARLYEKHPDDLDEHMT